MTSLLTHVRSIVGDATSVELAAAEALATYDYAAEKAALVAGYDVRVWDRTTPINGVDASALLERDDTPAEGDIVLVEHGGQIVYFQPHHPSGGPMAVGEGLAVGAALVDARVTDTVDAEYAVELVDLILIARPSTADDLQAQIDALTDLELGV